MLACPTPYRGIVFDSRLEARWTVYVDCLKFPFVCDRAQSTLQNRVSYIPDFYFGTLGLFGEVKPTIDPRPKDGERELIQRHSDYSRKWLPFTQSRRLVLLIQEPGNYRVYEVLPGGGFAEEVFFKTLNPISDVVIKANTYDFST